MHPTFVDPFSRLLNLCLLFFQPEQNRKRADAQRLRRQRERLARESRDIARGEAFYLFELFVSDPSARPAPLPTAPFLVTSPSVTRTRQSPLPPNGSRPLNASTVCFSFFLP